MKNKLHPLLIFLGASASFLLIQYASSQVVLNEAIQLVLTFVVYGLSYYMLKGMPPLKDATEEAMKKRKTLFTLAIIAWTASFFLIRFLYDQGIFDGSISLILNLAMFTLAAWVFKGGIKNK